MFQKDFVTSEQTLYPYQVLHRFNFWEFINGVEDFKDKETIYEINILENVSGEEYYNRFYFRRRQGWGKALFKNIQNSHNN
jgi:hypothetical protein